MCNRGMSRKTQDWLHFSIVQWWARCDGCWGVTLVSGLQHFNLWRIISWGWLVLLALGGWGPNRCSTKRHLFIHHAAVLTIPVGKKRILLMCSTIKHCKSSVVSLGIHGIWGLYPPPPTYWWAHSVGLGLIYCRTHCNKQIHTYKQCTQLIQVCPQ